MPKSRYNPDNEDIARKTSQLEEVLTSTIDALVHFIMSLLAPEKTYMAQEARIPLLKNLDAIKAYVAAKSVSKVGDQDEEDDMNTIINGEDNGDGEEIPQEEENNNLNQGGDNPVPMPPHSPRSSSRILQVSQN